MNNLLRIDNFSRISDSPTGEVRNSFINDLYPVLNSPSLLVKTISGKSHLSMKSPSTPETLPYMVSYPVPAETGTIGFRIGELSASTNQAIFGIVNVTQNTLATMVEFSIGDNGNLFLGYISNQDQSKYIDLNVKVSPDSYIDYTVTDISNESVPTTGRMIVFLDNTPIYNCTDITYVSGMQFMLMGSLPKTYGNDVEFDTIDVDVPMPTEPLQISITDLYISKNGKRYGMPNVITNDIDSATGSLPMPTDMNAIIDVWNPSRGAGNTTITFAERPSGERSQIDIVAASNEVNTEANVTITAGSQQTTNTVGTSMTRTSLIAGNVATFELEVTQ